MESARSQGKVEILLPCQTRDPARGSFMVHPMAVKRGGNTKRIPNPHYNPYDEDSDPTLPVFRSSHHVRHTKSGTAHEPHDESFMFAVDYGR